jgi:hypothetical protein
MPTARRPDDSPAPYRITTIATTARQETEVTVIGPGLAPQGQRYLFVSRQRAEMVLEAMNFAYAQGVREGIEIARVELRRK